MTRRDWRMACRGALVALTGVWAWQTAGPLACLALAAVALFIVGTTPAPDPDREYARRHPARRNRP